MSLLVFGGLLLFFYYQSNHALISDNQHAIAQDAAATVRSFIREKTILLAAIVRIENPVDAAPEKRKRYLQALLGVEPAFRNAALCDAQHRILASASRLSSRSSRQFSDRLTGNPLISEPAAGTVISPVFIDPATSEPLVILMVPVRDLFREYQGYVAVELNLKFIWDLVDRLSARVNGCVYVVDRQGNLIACGDTARVLRAENVSRVKAVRRFILSPRASKDAEVELYTGITGEAVVGTYLPLETPDWAVVVEVLQHFAYREFLNNGFLSLGLFLGFSVLAGLLSILIARRLAAPLVQLTETATGIAAGAKGASVSVSGPQEVAALATAFNSMTSQLLQSHADLAAQLMETRHSREALRESEERFRTIIDNANEIIYTLLPDGVFTFVSPAWTRLLGHPVEEVIGNHFSRYVHPDDCRLCEAFLETVLSTGRPQRDVVYRVKHLDGTWRWHTSAGSAVLDPAGRSCFYVGIAQDITLNREAEEEKAKLQQQLLQAQKMELIGRLAGGVAHDFNNMLNVILGYAELIKLDAAGDDSLVKKIDAVKQAADQAGEITRQLLAFSRKQIISPVSLDLNDFLEENKVKAANGS